MATTKPNERDEWRFWVHHLRLESKRIVPETALLNIKRFRLMSFVTIPLLLSFAFLVAIREVTTDLELRWQKGIVLFDLTMAAMYVLVNVAMMLVKSPKALPWIQGIAATMLLFLNVMLSIVGQLVSPNLTVLMVGLVSLGAIILFRPQTAILILFPNYLAFHFLLPVTQSDPTFVFSNRVNGFIVFVLAGFLSYLFWITKIQTSKQLTVIHDQRSQLESANKRLFELATTDRLTGLFNRGHMEELLSHKYAHLADTKKQIVLLLLDVDNFKVVNDQLGHPTGDQLLRDIASLLKRHQNEDLLLSRWGGDEFMIAMLKSDEESGQALAELLLPEVQELSATFRGVVIPISASIGVAVVKSTFEAAYREVDRTLYQAKLKGKGRVVLGSTEDSAR